MMIAAQKAATVEKAAEATRPATAKKAADDASVAEPERFVSAQIAACGGAV